jgi:beta-galactosidase
VPDGATATGWADALVPDGAETLAGYEHPHLGRWAAVTTHPHGRGRVTYVGTLPSRPMAVALGRWLRPGPDRWTDRPPSVTITTARNRAGDRLLFVSNWSWHRVTVPLPVAARDLLSGTDFGPGGNLHLDTWDVRILVERPAEE